VLDSINLFYYFNPVSIGRMYPLHWSPPFDTGEPGICSEGVQFYDRLGVPTTALVELDRKSNEYEHVIRGIKCVCDIYVHRIERIQDYRQLKRYVAYRCAVCRDFGITTPCEIDVYMPFIKIFSRYEAEHGMMVFDKTEGEMCEVMTDGMHINNTPTIVHEGGIRGYRSISDAISRYKELPSYSEYGRNYLLKGKMFIGNCYNTPADKNIVHMRPKYQSSYKNGMYVAYRDEMFYPEYLICYSEIHGYAAGDCNDASPVNCGGPILPFGKAIPVFDVREECIKKFMCEPDTTFHRENEILDKSRAGLTHRPEIMRQIWG